MTLQKLDALIALMVATAGILVQIAAADEEGEIKASCVLWNSADIAENYGQITICQKTPGGPVRFTGDLAGFAPSTTHAFHIHERGMEFKELDYCENAGNDFNPFGSIHGGPGDRVRHVGDLGNVVADGSGKAKVNFTNNFVSLGGRKSIMGRMCVLHANKDDLGKGCTPASTTTGNAGARIGCGVIGYF